MRAQGENQSCMYFIDYNNLPDFAIGFKRELGLEFENLDKANKFISYLQELKDIRNKCNHYQALDNEEVLLQAQERNHQRDDRDQRTGNHEVLDSLTACG